MGVWYHFFCPACGWRGVRYRNVRRCPRCRRPLRRGRPAVQGAVAGCLRFGRWALAWPAAAPGAAYLVRQLPAPGPTDVRFLPPGWQEQN